MKEDPPTYAIADFICHFLGGAMAFAFFPGWLLAMAGVPPTTVLLLDLLAGLAGAIYLHINREKR